MSPQTVYIIGVGPGDPSLISARGLRYLRAADVIVHDHLVHPRLLRLARPGAERIDVGASAPQTQEHDAICLLLAEKAREGKSVVRLKWGDPFVFDSGGRAALFLHEQNIPFEVVPGVPALIAVPCYAGIPVSYPGSGDTVTFVRGFEDESDSAPDVDWTSLARLDGTIVCFAGARQVPRIVQSLLGHGRSPDDSAAIVYDGTLPQQKTIQGKLGRLVELTANERRPGILVIGPVAGLRDHLRWFDARPLFGKRIVVTRSREQAGELVERLEELGAQAIEAPSVRIEPASDAGPLAEACATADAYDWIVFTSVNGVEHFMQQLLAGPGDVRSLRGPLLCAADGQTAEHIARYGIKVDLRPMARQTDAIVEAMAARRPLQRSRVLFPHAEAARERLADDLRRAGAAVTEVAAYRAVRDTAVREGEPDIFKMLLEGQIDAVTFTSPTTVSHLVGLLGKDAAADLLHTTVVASMGPVTAEAAQQLGIRTDILPQEFTVNGLLQALIEFFRARPVPAPA